MTAAALLVEIRRRGVEVARHGDELVLHGNTAALTEKALAAIKAAKPALLQLLAVEAQADALVSAAYRAIGETLPGGAAPWADRARPELMRAVDAATARWEAAYAARDLGALRVALAEFLAVLTAVEAAYTAADRQPAQAEHGE